MPIGTGLNGNGHTIEALAVHGNRLFAFGWMLDIGGAIDSAAVLNDGVWEPLSMGATGSVLSALSSMGTLWMVGDFQATNDPSATSVAQWTDGRPWFIEGPAQQIIEAGATAWMTCAVGNDSPETAYQWRRNGNGLADGPAPDGSMVLGAATSSLQIINAGIESTGTYDCVVTNECGSLLSYSAPLWVWNDEMNDLTCDGVNDGADVAAFALALIDPAAYESQYPSCDLQRADMNFDGSVDGRDVQEFVKRTLN